MSEGHAFYKRDILDQRIIKEIGEEFGLTHIEAYCVLEDYFRQVKDFVQKGKTIRIPELGVLLPSPKKMKRKNKQPRSSKLRTRDIYKENTAHPDAETKEKPIKKKILKK